MATEMESESDGEYEILYPGDDATREILDDSDYYNKFMPHTDALSESVLRFCGSFPVRMAPLIATSLVQRFTDARFNWATKTLQSFLEVVCWTSVTYATYSLYGDMLLALQVGTFVGAMMSVCDEVVLQFVRGLALVIRNQPGGGDLLQRLGFDVPKNGKAPTDGQEITLIKNLVFGYLGVVAVRSLWENFHDIKFFALLTACTGVAFVVTAEFFCLWLPTRRVGLTLQSRFTKVQRNWQEHCFRSFVEMLCWTMSTSYLYYSSNDFWWAFRVGTLVAVGVSLSSGLDHLADIDINKSEKAEYGFWEERALDDPFMAVAARLAKVQHTLEVFGRAVEAEAMNMYENFGE
ncbi:F-box protein [Phytophthora palmivora]|uniref:F-box protein n=1 Tax=Phytophthora palmivora TaxID=4796 RepID=A0A2P4XKK2_9STRA|nr:F-box protein [Phytophthora palmivora]